MSDEQKIKLKEFDELVTAATKVAINCAAAAEILRESLVKAASTFSSFERFYCRKCKKFFLRKQLKEITSLRIPCPECGNGLVSARNIKPEDEKEET